MVVTAKNWAPKFEDDPRYKQSIRLRPVADVIYRRIFGDDIQIERIEKLADFVLDRVFAIDVIITLPTEHILTGQEKFLSCKYAYKNSLTVEYKNNPNKLGDWFNLACQFYLCGYASLDESYFKPYAIVNWTNIVIETLRNKIKWNDNTNQNGRAQASFKYVNFDTLPLNTIIDGKF
jgi:hypothetical protein